MADTNQAPKDLIGFLDYYLVQKAPFQLPEGAREWIVKFGPWIAIVFLVLSLPALLVIFGLGAMFTPFGGLRYAAGFTYLSVFVIIQIGLEVAALPGLFARKMSGWRLLFYSQLVSIVGSLLSYNILGALVGGLIGMYLLFQIRMKYTE